MPRTTDNQRQTPTKKQARGGRKKRSAASALMMMMSRADVAPECLTEDDLTIPPSTRQERMGRAKPARYDRDITPPLVTAQVETLRSNPVPSATRWSRKQGDRDVTPPLAPATVRMLSSSTSLPLGSAKRLQANARSLNQESAYRSRRREDEQEQEQEQEGPVQEKSSSTSIAKRSSTGKRAKRVIHQIFADCMEFTDDNQWKDYLSDAASGKLHNASFAHNRLKSKGYVSQELTVQNLGSMENVLKEIKDFFQQKMHVCFTETDKTRAENIETPQFDPQTLNELPVKLLSMYIQKYTEAKGAELHMTQEEIRNLYQDINYNIHMKKLSKSSVKMRNRQIVDIEGAGIRNNKFYLAYDGAEGEAEGEGEGEAEADEDVLVRRSLEDSSTSSQSLADLIRSGRVAPINSDFRLDYSKNKMATKWKRLLKAVM